MNRRELMRRAAATAGVQALASFSSDDLMALGRELHAEAGAQGAQGAQDAQDAQDALDTQATRTVTAAAEIILPNDGTPGATDAGVAAFIDRMMAGWYSPEERDRFLAGLADLDARSQGAHGRAFADAPPAGQLALLTALDGEVTALRAGPNAATANQHWFAILKYLTVWGYATSAVGAQSAGLFQMAMRYDPCAPYTPPAGRP